MESEKLDAELAALIRAVPTRRFTRTLFPVYVVIKDGDMHVAAADAYINTRLHRGDVEVEMWPVAFRVLLFGDELTAIAEEDWVESISYDKSIFGPRA